MGFLAEKAHFVILGRAQSWAQKGPKRSFRAPVDFWPQEPPGPQQRKAHEVTRPHGASSWRRPILSFWAGPKVGPKEGPTDPFGPLLTYGPRTPPAFGSKTLTERQASTTPPHGKGPFLLFWAGPKVGPKEGPTDSPWALADLQPKDPSGPRQRNAHKVTRPHEASSWKRPILSFWAGLGPKRARLIHFGPWLTYGLRPFRPLVGELSRCDKGPRGLFAEKAPFVVQGRALSRAPEGLRAHDVECLRSH